MQKTIKKQFQKSMGNYNKNAVVQKLLAEKSAAYLNGKYFDSILEIGAGTGLLTEQLVKNCKFKNFYANDLVEKSEIYLKKFVPEVKFFSGDFQRVKFCRKFDLIAANAVFQWFDAIEKVFLQCADLLNKNGLLLFSTFSPKNFKEIEDISGLSLKYKTPKELNSILQEKFDIIKFENFEYKLKFDNPLKVLAHMKNTGVNSLSDNNWGIKEVKNFCELYLEKYPDLELTYSPIIILAKLK